MRISGGRPELSAWRFVFGFGAVSLCADVVYEGARSVTGPLLASLGATAAVVGVVTGVGEAAALGLRLVSGALTDRTRSFWAWTVAGYAISMVSVPLLGFTGLLWVACGLVIAERVGKAVRSPAKDTLLSYATAKAGRGKGFAVHEALDQVGALLGPLVVAGVLAVSDTDYRVAFGVLAVPATVTLALLAWLRKRVPRPEMYEVPPIDTVKAPRTAAATEHAPKTPAKQSFPREFWLYSAFTALTMCGFATFGVLSFHMATRAGVESAAVAIVYAAAMVADAVTALGIGWAYDRIGARVLVALPVLAAAVPVLAFRNALAWCVVGALVWGAAVGIQESTMRAVVADLVGPDRRATAYGIYAAASGVAAALGGTITGLLYEVSIPALIGVVVAIQAAALILLRQTGIRPSRPRPEARPAA